MKILMVLTSHDELGSTGNKPGLAEDDFAMIDNRNSLTVIQLNDSHAYFDLRQEMFWLGGQAVYRPAEGYARIARLVKQIRGCNRQQHTERSMEELKKYLDRHRPLRAELRGTFVPV